MDTPPQRAEAPPAATPPRPLRRLAGFLVGAGLLAAALVAAGRHGDALSQAVHAAKAAPWWLIVLALTLPLLNWLLTSIIFWLLMHPAQRTACRPVALGEMVWLIGAAWLLNYLPLSPGLFGRVAYHARVHGIGVRDSLLVIVASLIGGCVAIAMVLGLSVLLAARASPSAFILSLATAGPLIVLLALWQRRRGNTHWYALAALGVRILDVLVWGARYAVLLAALGQPVTAPGAAGMAVVSQAAMQIPFIGNGLGVREWAVGLLGPLIPSWFGGAGAMTTGAGLSLDLVNRACEVAVAVPVGVAAFVVLSRRGRRERAAGAGV